MEDSEPSSVRPSQHRNYKLLGVVVVLVVVKLKLKTIFTLSLIIYKYTKAIGLKTILLKTKVFKERKLIKLRFNYLKILKYSLKRNYKKVIIKYLKKKDIYKSYVKGLTTSILVNIKLIKNKYNKKELRGILKALKRVYNSLYKLNNIELKDFFSKYKELYLKKRKRAKLLGYLLYKVIKNLKAFLLKDYLTISIVKVTLVGIKILDLFSLLDYKGLKYTIVYLKGFLRILPLIIRILRPILLRKYNNKVNLKLFIIKFILSLYRLKIYPLSIEIRLFRLVVLLITFIIKKYKYLITKLKRYNTLEV
ncbi:hypothetical protein LZ32DRAFT_622126 [Colletotrichum eremochloae]|nr:hypothetical protein LZ32DRAFT_622126 [Colletotrichum eremochloae]